MLEQARGKAEAQDIRNIDFIFYDANSMNFESCSFDLIFCCEALVLLDKSIEQLQAWNRYLRPGGVVAFTCTHETSYFAEQLQQALQGAGAAMRACSYAHAPATWYKRQNSASSGISQFQTPDD